LDYEEEGRGEREKREREREREREMEGAREFFPRITSADEKEEKKFRG
jgi:hypothetical protein